MASADVKKVLQLKLQLKESTEGQTLLKTLKKLQRLDITLDILAETGIGKVVNSFRKHSDAGEVAKTLVHRWKKLVPKDSSSAAQPDPPPLKEPSKSEAQVSDPSSENNSSSERRSKKENSGSECRPSKSADKKGRAKRAPDKPKGGTDGENKDSDLKKPSRSKEKSSSDCHPEEKEERRKPEKKVSDITNKHRAKTPAKRSSAKGDVSIERDGKKRGFSKNKKEKKRKPRAAGVEKDPEGEDFEMPSMSFEAYLSYDLEAPKRRKKSCDSKNPKRLKVDQREEPRVCVPSAKAGKEAPDTTVAIGEVELVYGPYGQILIGCVSLRLGFKGSVMDLLKVPLPPISADCEDLSQYQYFAKRKVEEKSAEVCEEAPVFTGQRLNRKMQVYSGSKVVFLPTMMSLYQQCIRTLQNNIDSLYEIGGVPFEILEPVLERCTSEQLLRIEECNPVYIGVTDHLWERHCQRDFRNAQLEEYESWREMYLRLFEERERKLQQLTKSIVLAHSGKPKGRQVKMAFIHSAAKPPRNIRIQQELHGTASAGLPHPTDKPSGKSHESRGRPCPSEPASSGSNQCPDPRKIRRVAPMMAKSLKAFKKQLGRR